MKKAFITGIAGFVGQHLARLLLDTGHTVSGIYCMDSDLPAIEPEIRKNLTLYQCDITDKQAVAGVFSNINVDVVYHLAAVSHVPFAEHNPARAFDVNTMGTWNLLDAVKDIPHSKFVLISSCEVYGRQSCGRRLFTESDPVLPSNVYGVTKASAEMLCNSYAHRYGLRTIIFRPFNHIGAGQACTFVASDFARQIVRIERGDVAPEITVGNLDVMRDFSDVRDVVSAYIIAGETISDNGLFNVCSGNPITIRTLLDTLLSIANADISIKVDTEKFRKNDNDYFGGSYKKLFDRTGWKPVIPLEKTLTDILNYWRKQSYVKY
ncbi:MAG: SDR family oxidoreductase [Candidatus Auribacterota bacterium]|jgi:GDP-4-dehydro-6-deoxy-D-mannose reductase|nr:SDR family oxidoreductase [Candidatus Auribacterota bacterium]